MFCLIPRSVPEPERERERTKATASQGFLKRTIAAEKERERPIHQCRKGGGKGGGGGGGGENGDESVLDVHTP